MEDVTKSLVFLITYDCNLRCSYCYEPKNSRKAMTIDSARHIVSKAIDDVDNHYNQIDIQFMGGEPLLQFDLLKEISEWIWAQKQRIPIKELSAPTNGTLLTEEMKEWFAKNRKRFSLQLSFDGNRLMQNVNRSNSANNVDLDWFARTFPEGGVKVTLSPQTISHFYEGIMFLYGKGFKVVQANLAYGSNLGWGTKHLHILNQELDKLIDYYSIHPEIQPTALLDIPVWNILDDNAPDMTCRFGIDLLCYDCDGQIYPCHMFSPITISREKAEAVQHLDYTIIRQSNNTPCVRCVLNKMCIKCYGINYRDRNNCNSMSPFDCAQYKLFFFASCKLHKLRAKFIGDQEKERTINETIKYLIKSIKNGKNGI